MAPSSKFVRVLGATWPILGAIWGRAGSQGGSKNHVFGYHVRKMMKKGCPKTRPEKTSKFDWKLISNWEGLGGENERFAGDVSQNRSFRGVWKCEGKWVIKWFKNGAKIKLWVVLERTFAIFGRLGRVLFFDAFFVQQKVGPKWHPKSAKWRQNVLQIYVWRLPLCGFVKNMFFFKPQ